MALDLRGHVFTEEPPSSSNKSLKALLVEVIDTVMVQPIRLHKDCRSGVGGRRLDNKHTCQY